MRFSRSKVYRRIVRSAKEKPQKVRQRRINEFNRAASIKNILESGKLLCIVVIQNAIGACVSCPSHQDIQGKISHRSQYLYDGLVQE